MNSPAVVSLLVSLALLIVLAYFCGRLAQRLGQPAVIGEICCGVLLGPLLPIKPMLDTVLTSNTQVIVSGVADMGLAVFLYGIGSELAPVFVAKLTKKVSIRAVGSIGVPFLCGLALACALAGSHGGGHYFAFIVFFAAAMSVTAFPVLARILADRDMVASNDGKTALAVAACADVFAWAILAPVMASMSTSTTGNQLWLLILVIPYVMVMLRVVRPLSQHYPKVFGSPAVIIGVICASSAMTEWLGLHFSIGAFLAGIALAPSGTQYKVSALNTVSVRGVGTILVPLYFLLAGQQVTIAGFNGQLIGEAAVIIIVAIISKFGGAFLGARYAGDTGRTALTFATLMNTRGLTEILFLTIGLQQGIIDSQLYAVMILMAVVTTATTGPVLNWLGPKNNTSYSSDAPQQALG